VERIEQVRLTRDRSIGGTIGTALYVQIGRGLLNGGPASLFIAFTLWCSVILAVTLCMAEMVTYLPISSPFIRFAGRYGSEAFGFAVSTFDEYQPRDPSR
jgi:amino acid transporter